MLTPVLATKLFIPPLRASLVPRPHLIGRLDAGLAAGRRLSLISAPAGFGKTSLVSQWLTRIEDSELRIEKTEQRIDHSSFSIPHSLFKVAWLSLDAGDGDLARFLVYLVAALQTIDATVGAGVVGVLQSPQLPPLEALLITLLNDLAALPDRIVLVLDDYHALESPAVDQALAFLVERMPPQLHLVLVTREDPRLPLARLRTRDQLTELRAADLCFTPAEAAAFLTQVMGLTLSADEIAALEARTEGWVAGLQLAALSMQGRDDIAGFIQSFAGSHRFVLDYLVEEVLQRQPEPIQTFLLRTSILDRLCGPLCDALMKAEGSGPRADASEPQPSALNLQPSALILAQLERANLFIVPLDSERRWYRYHHLFGDLLRQRLGQSLAPGEGTALHIRASAWYEQSGLLFEAFHHAAAANDVERAARLAEGHGTPLYYRGVVRPILQWLESLPTNVLDSRPSLWVMYASLLLFHGQSAGIEQKLQAAEAALQRSRPDDRTQDLVGQIAAMRALLAVPANEVESVIAQARRALELLHPDNLPVRAHTTWALGKAFALQGDRATASQAYREVIALCQASGNMMFALAALTSLGNLQESENQLYLAAETYRRALSLFGDQPQPFACKAQLGLARIFYEWGDLDAAEQHSQLSLQLARQVENTGTVASCRVLLARLRLVRGDLIGAAAMVAEAAVFVQQHHFVALIPEVAAAQVLTMLRQGDLVAAAELAERHKLPISHARVLLAQGDPAAALALLEPFRRQTEARGWQDEQLKALVVQVIALHAHGDKDTAIQLLEEALTLAEPGGFMRTFVDEGEPMRLLLLDVRLQIAEQAREGHKPIAYVDKLLAASAQPVATTQKSTIDNPQSEIVDSLSQRELKVLQLIAQGLSNREISERLFLALSTIKGHNQKIFDKLQVQSRTEAIARARELGLL